MDWKLFLQLATTLFVALLGGWIGHHLAARRDLANERRKLLVSYLLEAYRKLEGASNRDADGQLQARTQFESAIADIQLLGSHRQVLLARQFALDMADRGTAPLDQLIFDLRQSLRSELELEAVPESAIYLRFSKRIEHK